MMFTESPVIIDSAFEVDLAVLAPAGRSIPDGSLGLRNQIFLPVSLSSGKIIWKTLRVLPAAVIETVISRSNMRRQTLCNGIGKLIIESYGRVQVVAAALVISVAQQNLPWVHASDAVLDFHDFAIHQARRGQWIRK